MNKRIFAAVLIAACLSTTAVQAQIFPRLFQSRAAASPAATYRGVYQGRHGVFRPFAQMTNCPWSNGQYTTNVQTTNQQQEPLKGAGSAEENKAAEEAKAASDALKVEVGLTRVVDPMEQEVVVSDIEEAGVPEAVDVVSTEAPAENVAEEPQAEEGAAAAEEPQAGSVEEESVQEESAQDETVRRFMGLESCLAKLNAIRAQHGIRAALRIDGRLQNGASNHAANMRASGQVYHAPGCGFEICAQSYGASIDGAINQFLNSPAHRSILLQSGFRTCGIGQYNDQYGRAFVVIRFGY